MAQAQRGHRVVSTHSRPKAAGYLLSREGETLRVSTHSRPKAAGVNHSYVKRRTCCFNTQPPEGGWLPENDLLLRFNAVSTHSRPKAAGAILMGLFPYCKFQHTAARRRLALPQTEMMGQTMFQHTAARRRLATRTTNPARTGSFNTQPPEGGWLHRSGGNVFISVFQHTAARRRLDKSDRSKFVVICVSTHSRPKAAGNPLVYAPVANDVSTHSRPKAAGSPSFIRLIRLSVSTHSRPKAAGNAQTASGIFFWFQHTAARRRLANQLGR